MQYSRRMHYPWAPSLVLLVTTLLSLGTREPAAFSDAFIPKPTLLRPKAVHAIRSKPGLAFRTLGLRMVTAPDVDSADPFTVLGLDPYDGTYIDKPAIKKAYKSMAVRYHPDAATNIDSSVYDKKWASEQFAKVNVAYEELLGQLHATGYVTPKGPNKNMRRPSASRRRSAYSDNFSANSGRYSSVSSPQYPDDFWVGGKDTFSNPTYYNPNQKNPFGNSRSGAGTGDHWFDSSEYSVNDYGACGKPFGGTWVGAGSRDFDPHSYGSSQGPAAVENEVNETVFRDFYSGLEDDAAYEYKHKPKEYPKRDPSSPSETMFNDFTGRVSTEAYKHKRFYDAAFGEDHSADGEETVFNDFFSGEDNYTSASSETDGSTSDFNTKSATGPETVFEDFLTGAFNGFTEGNDLETADAEKGASSDGDTVKQDKVADDFFGAESISIDGESSSHNGSGFSGGAVTNQGSLHEPGAYNGGTVVSNQGPLHEPGAFNGGTVNIGKTVVDDAAKKAAAAYGAFNGGTVNDATKDIGTAKEVVNVETVDGAAKVESVANGAVSGEVVNGETVDVETKLVDVANDAVNAEAVDTATMANGAVSGETVDASSELGDMANGVVNGDSVDTATMANGSVNGFSVEEDSVNSKATEPTIIGANVYEAAKSHMNGVPFVGTFSGGTVNAETPGVSVGVGTGTSTNRPDIKPASASGPETTFNDFYSGDEEPAEGPSLAEPVQSEPPTPVYTKEGGGAVFQDLVDLLKGSSNSGLSTMARQADDADLSVLLDTGTMDEIGSEMVDTELVVKQLTSKFQDLEEEIQDIQSELVMNKRFANKIALEQLEAECMARKDVVEKFLPKAQERMLALQIRYKQLVDSSQPQGGGGMGDQTPGPNGLQAKQPSTFYSRAPSIPFTSAYDAAHQEELLQEEEAARRRREEVSAKRKERLKAMRNMRVDDAWTSRDRYGFEDYEG